MSKIDADALIEELDAWALNLTGKTKFDMYIRDDAICVIDGMPTIDVAPVRHAMWVEYGENKDGTHNMRCSKCGAGLKSKGHANSYYTKHKYRYCQNCGAKMDEENTDAE